jgi:hypothetical protein
VVMRVLRSFDWRGFRAFGVSRVIELLWALLSWLLSDNNHPFTPWLCPCLAVLADGDIDFRNMVTVREIAARQRQFKERPS